MSEYSKYHIPDQKKIYVTLWQSIWEHKCQHIVYGGNHVMILCQVHARMFFRIYMSRHMSTYVRRHIGNYVRVSQSLCQYTHQNARGDCCRYKCLNACQNMLSENMLDFMICFVSLFLVPWKCIYQHIYINAIIVNLICTCIYSWFVFMFLLRWKSHEVK